MTRRAHMSRRDCLSLMLGAGALLASPRSGQLTPTWRHPHTVPPRRLAALLGHRGSARAIGLAYLHERPAENRVHQLLPLLLADVDIGHGQLTAACDLALQRRISARIELDFAEERVVRLHGWILSVTEARLCALATLA